jgi:hypothetical protein
MTNTPDGDTGRCRNRSRVSGSLRWMSVSRPIIHMNRNVATTPSHENSRPVASAFGNPYRPPTNPPTNRPTAAITAITVSRSKMTWLAMPPRRNWFTRMRERSQTNVARWLVFTPRPLPAN